MTKNDNKKKTIVYEFANEIKSIVEIDAHMADSIEVSRREEEVMKESVAIGLR